MPRARTGRCPHERAGLTVRDAVFRAVARLRHDHDLRQSRLDRAADVPRLPRRLPLRARPPGIGRGRHGRRLRPGDPQRRSGQPPLRGRHRPRARQSVHRLPQPHAAGRRRRPAGALDPALSSVPLRRAGDRIPQALCQMERASRRAPRTCPPRSPAPIISPCSRRAGPVFVSVPVDDWDRPCEPLARAAGQPRRCAATRACSPSSPARSPAPSGPVIVVGAEAARDGAWDETIALAERHRAPVWVEPDVEPQQLSPRTIRCSPASSPPAASAIVADLAGHDLILVARRAGLHLSCRRLRPASARGRRRCSSSSTIPPLAAAAPVGTAIVGDIRDGARRPAGRPRRRSRGRSRRPLDPPGRAGARAADRRLVLSRLAALRPPRQHHRRGSAVGARRRCTISCRSSTRDTFYTCASGGLGYGLPAAIGVALGRPGEKVIALLGDGSAMYAIQALWSAAQLRLPISFVIVNNRRYEALIGFGRRFGLNRTVGTELAGHRFRRAGRRAGRARRAGRDGRRARRRPVGIAGLVRTQSRRGGGRLIAAR